MEEREGRMGGKGRGELAKYGFGGNEERKERKACVRVN